MPILALGRKQKKKEKKKVPDQRSEESKRRKLPIKDWKKAKKERKILDQRSEENKRNIQKGLRTRQYLKNTKLSQANKKRKETTT